MCEKRKFMSNYQDWFELMGRQALSPLLGQYLLSLQTLLEIGEQVFVVFGVRQTLSSLLGNFNLDKETWLGINEQQS